jgi:hypothetical protein
MSPAIIAARAPHRPETVLAEQRSFQRYPIELEMEYRLLGKGQADHLGSGKTRNISSGGVLFEAPGLPPAGSSIELMLSWPFLLEGVCPLRLVMRGRIVRSDLHGVAIQSNYHEFRTAGTRIPKTPSSSLPVRAK